MNFFESQDQARKKTARLVLYFILAVTLIVLSVNALIFGVILYAQWQEPFFIKANETLSISDNPYVNLACYIIMWVSPVVIFILLMGTLFKMFSLREGGISLAKMVKAKLVDPNTQDLKEKQFLNIVEEMAIASGVPVPHLYIMEQEEAINAFVAGNKLEDMVMVVTKGALTNLNRDELQGVIGHEFSHVFNNDMRLNLKLIGVLGGIFALSQVGYFLMRSMGDGRSRKKSSKSEGDMTALILVIGLGVFLIGSIGLFFGRLIKASISRQRELLADAHAVQYTRNPKGLVNALRRIQKSEQGSYLQTQFVEDISHLCFSSSRALWLRELLATHPPLEKRIAYLDPQGMYTRDELSESTATQISSNHPTKKDLSALHQIAAASGQAAQMMEATHLQSTIGNPTESHFEYAQQIMLMMPPALRQATHEPDSVECIFYALMLENALDDEVKNILINAHSAVNLAQFLALKKIIDGLPIAAKLPLVELSLPAFKILSQVKREAIFQTMEQLAKLGKCRLLEAVLLALVGKATLARSTQAARYANFNTVLPEVSLLMAFIVTCGQHSSEKKNVLYQKMMRIFTEDAISLPKKSELQAGALFSALVKLNLLYPLCKDKLLKACIACVEEDNRITLSEAEMIRAVAACLDSPIPPIVPT